MLVRALVFSTILALGPQWTAFAQEAGEEAPAHIVFSRWPKDGQCTAANTTAVTLEELLRDRASFHDKCVSTVGFFAGYHFGLDRDGLGFTWSRPDPPRQLGLYAREETMEDIWSSDTTRARIVGVVWDCKDLHGPDVIMVMGYCHYTGGPIIGVASFHPIR